MTLFMFTRSFSSRSLFLSFVQYYLRVVVQAFTTKTFLRTIHLLEAEAYIEPDVSHKTVACGF